MTDYINHFRDSVHGESILRQRTLLSQKFSEPRFQKYRETLQSPPIKKSPSICLDNSFITIGSSEEISEQEKKSLEDNLRVFCPWRKGPFRIFGLEIDAEWRSDWKWERLLPFLDDMQGKRLADIGCNNGYFLFRMAHFQPDIAIGFDPTYRFQQNFYYLLRYTNISNLYFELFGFEHLPFYPNFFDIIFCLGVVYHHPSPLSVLQNCFLAMKKNAQLILDSITIDSLENFVLYPGKKYAGMKNVYFLPSPPVLKLWLEKAGFEEIQIVHDGRVKFDEQRSTPWAEVKSLFDFCSSENTDLTEEGFPMPRRTYITARKTKTK